MNNRVLSIEISNSFTKICEIDYKVKKPKVYKVLTVETPEGVVVDGMLQPTQEYALLSSGSLIGIVISM